MKKRILSILLVTAMVFSLNACSSKKSTDLNNTVSKSADYAASEKKEELSVEITLTDAFVGDDENALNEEAQNAGVEEITKSQKGYITMKMTKQTHEKLLTQIKTRINKRIEEILAYKVSYSSFDSISYNENVTEFLINVDSASYEDSQSSAASVFYREGNLYQALNKVPEEKLKTVVNFVDKDTGEIIKTLDSTMPESINAPVQAEVINKPAQAKKYPQQAAQADMSGDYIGNIPCPLPPENSSYTLYKTDNPHEAIVLYVENIDNANFRFYFTKALLLDPVNETKQEDIIFMPHIAHYTSSGYYEYIGRDYHLYFKYIVTPEAAETPYGYTIEVYGLDKLFVPTEYDFSIQYQNMWGNTFRMNVPFTA